MFKQISNKKLISITLILLIVFQFFRIDKTFKPVNLKNDFLSVTDVNSDVAKILKTACYDCHSDQPGYPWYTNIAPISWWIKHHINEGNHHLNFSLWGSYTQKRKTHKLEECINLIEEGSMPLFSYTIIHKDAKLNPEQKNILIKGLKNLLDSTINLHDKQ